MTLGAVGHGEPIADQASRHTSERAHPTRLLAPSAATTLCRVLADGSPPTVTPNRVQRAASKPQRHVPVWLLAIPVVLIVLGVGIFLLLRGGDVPILGGDDDTVPEFDFTIRKATGVPTVLEADTAALTSAAEAVGEEITPTIDDLFTNAFLDPSNWRDGDYEEVFAAFAPDAAASGQQQLETLTLGANAGETFERVEPERSTLAVDVLFDTESNPRTVVATVVFRATAERKDGTYLAIVSHAQFFLEDEGGWTITAFDVTRDDHETQPPATATSTASPSA